MLDKTFWLMISILAVLLVLGLVFVFFSYSLKKKRPVDFYMFFVLGIVWIVVGFVTNNYVFSIIGFIFACVGLYNKDKWKQNRKDFKKLNRKERIRTIVAVMILLFLLIVGFILFFVFNSNQEILIGGDKDEHGCLFAAGYNYCPSTGQCQRMWEVYCEEYKEFFRG